MTVDPVRIHNAWAGRIAGCNLGKPVELLSMQRGYDELQDVLAAAGALPVRDYLPYVEHEAIPEFLGASCKGRIQRSEPDDDINYSVLALMMLEQSGAALSTADVGRAWLNLLPVGMTFTAERSAFATLVSKASMMFSFSGEPGFDLAECSDNEYNDWIGAQIRADVYGWVAPGNPALAAKLVRADAELSHRGEGVYGAVFVAALGAAIPVHPSLDEAVDAALAEIPADSDCAAAVALGRSLVGTENAAARLHQHYSDLHPVHTVNNLALVVWALLSHPDDFSAAIGEAVAAGWDTDCNGATVGGLWGLQGKPIPSHWTEPWQGRVAVKLVGLDELALEDLVSRTVAVAEDLQREIGE